MTFIKILRLSILLFIVLLCIGAISAEDNLTDNSTEEFEVPTETFTDLDYLINNSQEGSSVNLTYNYRFDPDYDECLTEGIQISKNLTITGMNNVFIDGNFLARGLNINPNSNVVLKNIIFKNGYSKTGGAAILVGQNSSLLIDNCTFYSNMVYNSNGGAIYGLEGTNIDIHSSEFYNNSATRVSKLPWKEYKRGMGSVICMRIGSNLRLFDTVIRDNIGYLTTILIITWDDVNTNQSTLYVKNCLFENNIAKSNGVIYLDEYGIADILDSVFRNNVVTYTGGLITLDTSKKAVVKNCTFDGNSGINGGALYINSLSNDYRSNVTVVDCEFTKNSASNEGGAIFSKYATTSISNSHFEGNTAVYGGAVFTKIGSIKIYDSMFLKNSADYGGALYLKTDVNKVINSLFTQNYAVKAGGAVFSKMEVVSSSKCSFVKNSASKAPSVYGAFYAKVTKYVSASGAVRLKIVLTSPWNMPISQKIKINIPGYTSKWIKTNSKGLIRISIPKNKVVAKKTLTIKMDQGVCFVKSYIYKNPGKITLTKKVKKSSKLKVTIKNSQTKLPIKKIKFKVKIYTGKKYRTYFVKTNSKGIFKLSVKNLSKGNHKINVYLSSSKYYIDKKFSFKVI